MVLASGVPDLRRFCYKITAQAQLLEAKHFLQSTLSSLLSSVEIYASSSPPVPHVESRGQDESVHAFLIGLRAVVRDIFCQLQHQADQQNKGFRHN